MIALSRPVVFHGPSPFARVPAVVVDITLDEATNQHCETLRDELAAAFGAWFAPPDSGDLATSDAGIVQLLLNWSLAALTARGGCLELSGFRRIEASRFRAWIEFYDPAPLQMALKLAATTANAILAGQYDTNAVEAELQQLWNACARLHPGTSDCIIMHGARKLGIPYQSAWGTTKHWQFGWGARGEVFSFAASDRDGYLTGGLSHRKHLSKGAFEGLGLPTPDFAMVRNEGELAGAIEIIGFPCVIKPTDLAHGNGITVGVTSMDEARQAFALARGMSSAPIMLEQVAPGDDYRIVIFSGRVAAVVGRKPPEVTGDGVRSVRELVAELNKGRTLPGAHSPRRLISVPLDDAADAHLARQGLTADAVPDAGRVVTLRSNANISSGGSVEDWTDRAHPSVIEAAEALSRALKIHCGGIDFMSTDITRSLSEGNGNFIEFNLTPALTGATLIGWSTQDVCKAALLPETGRIPLQIIVVPEDKLDMVIDRVQSGAMTRGAGWATHDKAQLGFLDLEIRPLHPWSGIETLLMHRTLESATLILSSTMIRRHGLPVDHGDKITLIDNDLPDVWLRVLQDATPEPLQLATL